MKFKKVKFLSLVALSGYRQVTGAEAEEYVKSLGLSLVHADDDGLIYALSEKQQVINGCRVYEKLVPDFG